MAGVSQGGIEQRGRNAGKDVRRGGRGTRRWGEEEDGGKRRSVEEKRKRNVGKACGGEEEKPGNCRARFGAKFPWQRQRESKGFSRKWSF